jgi:Bacterial Ig domain
VFRPAIYLGLICAVTGCTGGQTNQGTSSSQSTPASSTLPPSISITSPASSATISGTITVSVTVANTNAVQFKIDGNNVGSPVTVTMSSFSYSVDTTTFANGMHTLSATANNSGGQTATSTISVNVNNAPKPTLSFAFPPSGAIVGGITDLMVGEAGSLGPLLNIQFKVDGNPVGSPSPSSIFSLDTTAFSNGSHSISAVATSLDGTVVSSTSVGVEIANFRQWRMFICSQGPSLQGSEWVVEANISQAGQNLSADSQNVTVFSFECQIPYSYPPSSPRAINSLLAKLPSATMSGETIDGQFQITFSQPGGLAPLYGTCFGPQLSSTPTSCNGSASMALGGPMCCTLEGFDMPTFSGTYSGTLSYPSGTKVVTVTLTQNPDYTLSASYSDATGAHVSAGKVIGGSFRLTQGFDGNPLTAIEQCPNVSSCSARALNIYDASLNYLGTLQ